MNDLVRCVIGIIALISALGLAIVAHYDRDLAEDLMPGVTSLIVAIVFAELAVTRRRSHRRG